MSVIRSKQAPALALHVQGAANIHQLPNDIRVVHKLVPSTRLVHVGMVMDVGSRDEGAGQQGMAHFIEHMVFKGTRKRKAYHILSRIDSVGGELNAFTTKEKTTYHATVTAEHLERAIELLADISFHSTFPGGELEKERGVVADEIDMYRDDPEEAIFEDFDRLLYPRHSLGHAILGTKASLAQFSQSKLQAFHRAQYGTNRTVLSVVGHCAESQVLQLAQHYMGRVRANRRAVQRQAPRVQQPKNLVVQRPIQQSHFILGGQGYGLRHLHYVPLVVLNYYLGGPSMNSRLSLAIRERHGLTYNIQTIYTPFVDSGVWGVYASSDPSQLERVQQLVQQELKLACSKKMSSTALDRLKKQFIGSMVIGYESLYNQMLSQAKDVLDFDTVFTIDQAVRNVERLTPADMLTAANEVMHPKLLSLLQYQPV